MGYCVYITRAGYELQAKLFAEGGDFLITKVEVGRGVCPKGTDPSMLTGLVERMAAATSTKPRREGCEVSLEVEYRSDLNGELETAFQINEFGVFALGANESEILLLYGDMSDFPETAVPQKYGGCVRRYPVNITIGPDAEVSLAYPAAAWMTCEEVDVALSTKQPKLTGQPGQIVGFDAYGAAAAMPGWSNHNILINADFRNPVNRNGKLEYENGFGIDMWVDDVGMTIEDGYISALGALYQFVSSDEAVNYLGKRVTLSLLRSNGELVFGTATVPDHVDPNVNQWARAVSSGGIELGLYVMKDGRIQIFRCNTPSDPVAVKTELGSQQTLAHKEGNSWVLNDPPDYDLQYAMCEQYDLATGEWIGSQHSNPNLLDNAYWASKEAIVNQRGQDEYTGPGYTIDRWLLRDVGASATIVDGGIKISTNWFVQNFEADRIAPGQYTLSVLCHGGGVYAITVGIYADTGIIDVPVTVKSSSGLAYGTFEMPESIVGLGTGISFMSDGNAIFQAAKLEPGPKQTLAHREGNTWVLNDPPPDRALELAKCQRYQLSLFREDGIQGYLGPFISREVEFIVGIIQTPVTMRVKPTAIADLSRLSFWDSCTIDTRYAVTAISIGGYTNSCIQVYLYLDGTVPVGHTGYLLSDSPGPDVLVLDANL